MSTQAASTRGQDRSAQQMPDRAVMEAPTRPMPPMYEERRESVQAPGTETKLSLLTTEFWVYLAAVAGILVTTVLVGENGAGTDPFRADNAWFLITLLTIAYLGSRGLAKMGNAFRTGTERRARH